MTASFHLEAYLARVGFGGAPTADLPTLTALHGLHAATMPFENLNPLMGLPVLLDPAALQAKLIGSRRGGYCFEQNAVFASALGAIGFDVIPLSARVRWMAPPDRPEGARSHMLLRVNLPDGAYLADVGFGGHIMGAPIKLVADLEQTHGPSSLRLRMAGAETFTLQTRLPGGWQDMYCFNLEPQFPSDYAVSNWFTSTHPDSIFIHTLMMERLTPRVRVSLTNRRLIERWADGRVTERRLASADDLAQVLDILFEVTPPTPAQAIWAKIPAD